MDSRTWPSASKTSLWVAKKLYKKHLEGLSEDSTLSFLSDSRRAELDESLVEADEEYQQAKLRAQQEVEMWDPKLPTKLDTDKDKETMLTYLQRQEGEIDQCSIFWCYRHTFLSLRCGIWAKVW